MKVRSANRSADQIVADLEVKIARVKARAERKRINAHPSIRLAKQAARLLEKAAGVADGSELKKALQDAALSTHGCIAIEGGALQAAVVESATLKRRRGREVTL